jgi:hypothetical protein
MTRSALVREGGPGQAFVEFAFVSSELHKRREIGLCIFADVIGLAVSRKPELPSTH